MKIIIFRFLQVLLIVSSLLLSQTSFSYPGRKDNPQFPDGPPRKNPRETIGAGHRVIEYPWTEDNNNPITPLPSDMNSPIRSESCFPKNNLPLTPLVPRNNLITTTAANPSLWFYIAENKTLMIELNITDEKGIIWSQQLDLSNKKGIMQINLPQAISLQTNRNYTWEFALICDLNDRSQDQHIEGKIQRIQLNQQQQEELKQIFDPLEKAQFYAKSELWDEALNSVAQLHPIMPKAWEDLLASVGLEKVTK